MSRETRKGVVRILSNYIRLLLTLMLGLLVVPLTIRWLGDDAFGIISLLGANIGLAAIFSQIITMSLVRELAQAYHADERTFSGHFGIICSISLGCALLSLLSFGIVFALVPAFKISPEFIAPARWFVAGQGLFISIRVLLSPILNMYLVKERFVGYNIWFIGVRAANILAVVLLGYIIAIDDPYTGLTALGVLWAAFSMLGIGIAAWLMAHSDPNLRLRFGKGTKESRKQVLDTFSWNTGVQIAMNIHEQVPPLLLNLFFGTLANAAWGIGFRFVAYIRMATTGVQFGSDAVSARLASNEDTEQSRKQLQRLINIQTKLTTMIALPAGAGVFLYSWPIFHAWVGHSLEDYDAVMTPAVIMSRILTIALAARAISDTWLLVLYGAGYVRAYAPWVFAGGVLAPVASLVLMFMLPDELSLYAPASMFALVLLSVHLFGLPFIAGRCLQLNPWRLFLGVLPPLLATALASAAGVSLLVMTGHGGDLGFTAPITRDAAAQMSEELILASIAVFGVVYALLCATIVLTKNDRARIAEMIRKRRKPGVPPDSV